MKYCIDFLPKTDAYSKADEILIPYDGKLQNFMGRIKEMLVQFPNQRQIVVIRGDDATPNLIEDIIALRDFQNLAIRVDAELDRNLNITEKDIIQKMVDANIPVFTNIFVNNFERLNGLLALGVSDVYIVESMGFHLDRVYNLVKGAGANKQIRVFPNICQTNWNSTPPPITFYIRPDDVKVYEKYVDVLELTFYINDQGKKVVDTLYKVYSNSQKWDGKLSEIINGFKGVTFDNRLVPKHFAERRTHCKQRCLMGDSCNMCLDIAEASKQMYEIYRQKLKENGIEGINLL